MSGNSSDTINAAIEAARLRAAASVTEQAVSAGAVATAPAAQASAVGLPRAAPLSMDDMAAGGISVDSWLGVKEFGFLVGPSKDLHPDPIVVDIDLSTVAPNFTIKFGNPAVYFKTYDKQTCATGGSWSEAIRKAQMADPGAREYRSCDLPMTLVADLTIKDKVVLEAGKKLGYSLSTTNWGAWETFYNEIKKRGLQGQTVSVCLGWEKRMNKNANVWGIMTFTLIDAVN